jgi:hypothetical protein
VDYPGETNLKNGVVTEEGTFKPTCGFSEEKEISTQYVCGTLPLSEETIEGGLGKEKVPVSDGCVFGCVEETGNCCESVSDSESTFVCDGKNVVAQIETTCGVKLNQNAVKITCPVGCEDGTCVTEGNECEGDQYVVCDEEGFQIYWCMNGHLGDTWGGMGSNCETFQNTGLVCDEGSCDGEETIEEVVEEVGNEGEMDAVGLAGDCVDSDGGENYYEKGSVVGPVCLEEYCEIQPAESDICILNNENVNSCSGLDCQIIEQSCRSDGVIQGVIMSCPGGCNDGACLPYDQNEQCVDSGDDLFEIDTVYYKTTNNQVIGLVDKCYKFGDIAEGYCNEQGFGKYKFQSCSEGYTCQDGVCVVG